MNAELLMPSGGRTWPEKVFTGWQRFSSGLWRVPKGDISAAYSAETFPKIKLFSHEGGLFTNNGGHFSGRVAAGVDCYPTPFSLEPTHAVGIRLCIKLCIEIVESY